MTQYLITREAGKWAVVSSVDGRPPYTRHGPLCPDTHSAGRLYDSTRAIVRVSPIREGDDVDAPGVSLIRPRLREAAHPAS